MPSVRTPLEALEFAKDFVGNAAIDGADIKIRILNYASSRMWMFAPWRWSIGEVGQTNLVEDQEDYTISDPGDMLHLVRAEIRKGALNNQVTGLNVVHNLLSQSAMKGPPRDISLFNATTVRLRPVPSGLASADPGRLFIWYKKANIEIVETGATGAQKNDDDADALTFPDEWFWAYQELVLYYAMKFTHDARAGGVAVTVSGGDIQQRYSGQLAEAIDALVQMSRKEKTFLDTEGRGVNG